MHSLVKAHRMPTVLSHPVVPLALGLAFGPSTVSRRLLLAGVVASVLPDLDVVAFRLGIGYSHELGRRGFSHSLLAALFFGAMAVALAKHLLATRKTAFLFVFLSAASHGLLDMFTNGGLVSCRNSKLHVSCNDSGTLMTGGSDAPDACGCDAGTAARAAS